MRLKDRRGLLSLYNGTPTQHYQRFTKNKGKKKPYLNEEIRLYSAIK